MRWIGFIVLMIGVVLIYTKAPVVDLAGVAMFLGGLFLPMFQKVNPERSHSKPRRENTMLHHTTNISRSVNGGSRLQQKLIESDRMATYYVEKANGASITNPDHLMAIRALIELSKRDQDFDVMLSAVERFSLLLTYEEEVMHRTRELAADLSQPTDIRQAAQRAQEHLERLRTEFVVNAG